MHTASPYIFRCYNPNKTGVPFDQRYDALDKIGNFDLYCVLRDFISSLDGRRYYQLGSKKRIYNFSTFIFDDSKRRIRGVFKSGSFGYKSDIINISTGAIDYSRVEQNAEIFNYFVDIIIPLGMNDAICLMFNHNGEGVKSIFHDVISAHFKSLTQRNLQMKPLAYATAYKEWANAQAKELRLVKFNECTDIADRLLKMGHGEQTLVISSGRKKDLGKLNDFLTNGTDQKALLDVITPMCSQVRTKVVLNGNTRTFRLGKNLSDQVCQIEIDEKDVPSVAGNPDMPALITWSQKILQELANNLYPGAGVKV